MTNTPLLIILSVLYFGVLFLIAFLGDKYWKKSYLRKLRPFAYALSIAVYCTSWTFLGAVGYATTAGFAFTAIYIGPFLAFTIGMPIFRRIIKLAKAQNSVSVADFMSARYGKSAIIGALVTVICIIGVVPYLALQLRAVSSLLITILDQNAAKMSDSTTYFAQGWDIAFIVSITMAAFAILFGTRHANATEHQEGLMLAIASESLVKILALTAVGLFVLFTIFDGPFGFISTVQSTPDFTDLLSINIPTSTFITILFISTTSIFLLPRQFHLTIVENRGLNELNKAKWLFPLYLVIINIFILPIAIAGLLIVGKGYDADLYVLLIPLLQDNSLLSIIAVLGGISAAVAMVTVAAVALSIMISNDIIFPIWLRYKKQNFEQLNYATALLNVRRFSIFCVMLLAYVYYTALGGTGALISIGLLSFAAIAQLAPAFFIGLIWQRANAKGAFLGIFSGICIWAYTLLLPLLYQSNLITGDILTIDSFSLYILTNPTIFGYEVEALTYGVFWSILANISCILSASFFFKSSDIEKSQAEFFVMERSDDIFLSHYYDSHRISIQKVQNTVAKFIGNHRAERSFTQYFETKKDIINPAGEANQDILQFAEHILASSIGASSARLVLSLLLTGEGIQKKSALKLLDDASEAIQYNRDILQAAIDHVKPGIAVFDQNSNMICWNASFRDLLKLPEPMRKVGISLKEILSHLNESGGFKPNDLLDVNKRYKKIAENFETFSDYLFNHSLIVEISTRPMNSGGFVTTITDVTEKVEAANALFASNELLEKRVKERTIELEELNKYLEIAKRLADASNANKTQFLAAASHDILQPLNAARLYTSALNEKTPNHSNDIKIIVDNIDKSLVSVEDILGTILDISRLDSGVLKPEIKQTSIQDIFNQLSVEFAPMAERRGLKLIFVSTSSWIYTDAKLFRRLLQNLISNAIKYTRKGKVLIGCRAQGENIRISVYDTGIGIPKSQQIKIFEEFKRLDAGAQEASGLGLGLAIVQRLANALGHMVSVTSENNQGTHFSILGKLATPKNESHEITTQAKQPFQDITGLKILCIDNEEIILKGMHMLLHGWQCEIATALSYEEAFDILNHQCFKPDILILDYHLDEGTGIHAYKKINENLEQKIPAIILTANRSAKLNEEIKELNLHLLTKPVKPAKLRALLSTMI